MVARQGIQAIFCCALLSLAACDAVPPPTPRTEPAETLGQSEVIALIELGASTAVLNDAAITAGYRQTASVRLDAIGQRMVTFALPGGVTGAQAIAYLEAAEPASTVGINHVYRLQSQTAASDPRVLPQALTNWPTSGCVARIPIGLIDSPVDTSQPGLAGVQVISEHFGRQAAASSRHGTDVAGVLADPARLRGATIYNASVMERGANGDPVAGADAVIRALDWLGGKDVRVVNLSIAGPYNKLLSRAVDAAADRGMILIAAAGNAGPNAAPQFPAAFEPVIAVTAVDANGAPYRNATRGAYVDLSAPGVDVYVRTDKGHFVTGTSVAAPFVTALIAGDRQLSGLHSAEAIRTELTRAATDLGPTGPDTTYGAGLVNAQGFCD